MSDLAKALMMAIRVHAGQTDRQGEPYLLHVLRVVEAVSDKAKVAAALHDAFEDGDWGDEPERANETCAYLDPDTLEALDHLTRTGESYTEYIEHIAVSDNAIAREVKLADLRDNLGRIPPRPERSWTTEVIDQGFGYDDTREAWDEVWSSLKARYERALAALGEREETR